MGTPVRFGGHNAILGKPGNLTDAECQPLAIYTNGAQCVSCWELTDDELAEIKRSRRVFVTVNSGRTQPPIYVGSERTVRSLITSLGSIVWNKGK